MDEPVLMTWIHEEDIRQRMKTDSGTVTGSHSMVEIVYQKNLYYNVSGFACCRKKKAAEMAETAAKYSGTENKRSDIQHFWNRENFREMQIIPVRLRQNSTTITADQINNWNHGSRQQRNPDIEAVTEAERE